QTEYRAGRTEQSEHPGGSPGRDSAARSGTGRLFERSQEVTPARMRGTVVLLLTLAALAALYVDLAPAIAQTPATSPPTSTATIHASTVRQPIYGFGGTQTYNGDALASFPNRDQVYRALFADLKLD